MKRERGEVRKRKEGGKKGGKMKTNKNKNKIFIHIVFLYIYRVSLENRRSDDLRREKEIRGLGNGRGGYIMQFSQDVFWYSLVFFFECVHSNKYIWNKNHYALTKNSLPKNPKNRYFKENSSAYELEQGVTGQSFIA